MTKHAWLALRWAAALALMGGFVRCSARAETLAAGPGCFEVTHADRQIPVWYFLPQRATADAPVLFVMHGVKRDADRYRDEWAPHAEKYGFVLVVPEFSEAAFPGAASYNFGNTLDEQLQRNPREQWTFRFLEPIFDAVKVATGNRSERYYLYGHSAGAQFVHRYLTFMPDARVAMAIAANAGWWTLPDPEVDVPYGLHGSGVDGDSLTTLLGRPLVVLLGTADNDPNHVYLRRTPEALEQGPHRFARGQFYFEAGRRRAAMLDVPFGWQLATVPGVGHSDKDMAPYAVRCLFDPPVITSRDPNRVRVLFGGDTSGGESYQEQYAAQGEANILAEKGYEYGLKHLDRLLAAADYRVINLETPLTARRDSPLKTKDYLHYSDPVKVPALFTRYGPLAFSLANNHTLDHGPAGLDDTRAALVAAGVDWFGAGENLAEAAKPLVQEFRVGGTSVTLALFGAFEYRRDYDEDFHFYASGSRPGAASIDVPAVRQAIVKLRQARPHVFVVYFVHWGGNYAWKTSEQAATVRALREAGVDLLIGHGAHMLQEVEHDGRGWVFYSIGNFLFNSRGRYSANQAPPYSMPLVVDLAIREGRVQADLRAYPIVSDNQLTGYQPRPVTDDELAKIEALLAEKSGWDAQARAAVKRGTDEMGSFLEFTAK